VICMGTQKKKFFHVWLRIQPHDSVDSRKNLLARVVSYIISLRSNFLAIKILTLELKKTEKLLLEFFY
jgi:hypothetical protein